MIGLLRVAFQLAAAGLAVASSPAPAVVTIAVSTDTAAIASPASTHAGPSHTMGPVLPVSGVPEPALWLLIVSGLGAVGLAFRKRQSARVVSS